MTRRELRDHLIKMLYMREFHDRDEIEEQNRLYLSLVAGITDDDISDEILGRYGQVVEKLGSIDSIIARVAKGWKLSRIGKMDLNILRLAAFEISYDDDVPDKVAVNEAVELAKEYGCNESSYGFVNGILSSLIKEKQENGKHL
ncbi:MAG: transcription antitermination factor NusB [Lachnospiraceae bacterium]|nr:transcription antitermination factor NusB [Lachnospiraceae bacterium]